MTGLRFVLDIRCATAARLLGADAAKCLPGVSGEIALRVAADGRFAALRDLSTFGTSPRPARAHTPHPSWSAAAVAVLPPPVACRLLDRLGASHARAVLAELDRETSQRLRAAPTAASPDIVDALLGRGAPPAFPPPPPWADPVGLPDVVARAAAREPDWPADAGRWGAAEVSAAACARGAVGAVARADGEVVWPGEETARGLARVAFALFDRPDDAWGLAGAWPRLAGIALLAAWNAWPDLGALHPDAVPVRQEAARRVRERWSSWAG